jgi:hypothetical protein
MSFSKFLGGFAAQKLAKTSSSPFLLGRGVGGMGKK